MASPRYYKLVPVTGNQGDAFNHSPPLPSPQNYSTGNHYSPMNSLQNNNIQHELPKPGYQRSYDNGVQQRAPMQMIDPAFPQLQAFSTFPNFPALPDMQGQMEAMRQRMFMSGAPGAPHAALGQPMMSPFPTSGQHMFAPMRTMDEVPTITSDPVTGDKKLSLRVDVTGFEANEILINTDGDILDVYAVSRRAGNSREFRKQFTLPFSVRDSEVRCSFVDNGQLVIEAFSRNTLCLLPAASPKTITGNSPTSGGLLMPANGSLNRKKKRVTFALQ